LLTLPLAPGIIAARAAARAGHSLSTDEPHLSRDQKTLTAPMERSMNGLQTTSPKSHCLAPGRIRRHPAADRAGFTVIELLVTIAIVAVLLALLTPSINAARESARLTQCRDNLRTIALGVHRFHYGSNWLPTGGVQAATSGEFWIRVTDDTPGVLRPAPRNECGSSPCGYQSWGWLYQILPYVDEAELWRETNERLIRSRQLALFRCPSDSRTDGAIANTLFPGLQTASFAETNYAGNAGTEAGSFLADCDETALNLPETNGVFIRAYHLGGSFFGRHSFASIRDGQAYTILAGETWQDPDNDGAQGPGQVLGFVGSWPMQPGSECSDIPFAATDTLRIVSQHFGPCKPGSRDGVSADVRALNFGSHHTNGANFAMADGSVRFISYGIDKVDGPPTAEFPDGIPSVFTRLGTIAGGEIIESGSF
jgi:prepilin-type N-terminal cleavage/methylation domain-containing protein/prepilin-type processing-associated H-X9-DG protein